jgi:hypothetical protein
MGYCPSHLILLERGRRQVFEFVEMGFCMIAFVPSMGSTWVGGHEFIADPALLMVEFGRPIVHLNYHSDQYNI